MPPKRLETLVEDIEGLFRQPHICDPERVQKLGESIASKIAFRLAEDRSGEPFRLRMSNIGKEDRQLWYEAHVAGEREELEPHVKMKFLYGDILEDVLIFLSAEAGHTVDNIQTKVEVDGIMGSMDCTIDNVVVDCKSASTYSYNKFKNGNLAENDPFGYMEQLAGYNAGLDSQIGGAFLVIDKTLGHICLDYHDQDELDGLQIRDRIAHLKTVIASPELPERCFDAEPDGKSGNMALGVNCSYCSFKDACWADANGGLGPRTFLYAGKPRHLVEVVREPNVPELTFG